jgi:hypothetical protein
MMPSVAYLFAPELRAGSGMSPWGGLVAPRRDGASLALADQGTRIVGGVDQGTSGTCTNLRSQYVPMGNSTTSPSVQRDHASL